MGTKEKQLVILARLIDTLSIDADVRQVITGCVIKNEAQWLNNPIMLCEGTVCFS